MVRTAALLLALLCPLAWGQAPDPERSVPGGHANHHAGEKTAETAGEKEGTYQDRAVDQHSSANSEPSTVKSIDEIAPPISKNNETRHRQRNEKKVPPTAEQISLQAQSDAARYTGILAAIGFFQLVASGIGIAFVYRTFAETRKHTEYARASSEHAETSAQAAIDSAKAAQDSLEETRLQFLAGNRPWLRVRVETAGLACQDATLPKGVSESAGPFVKGAGFPIKVIVENMNAALAPIVKVRVSVVQSKPESTNSTRHIALKEQREVVEQLDTSGAPDLVWFTGVGEVGITHWFSSNGEPCPHLTLVVGVFYNSTHSTDCRYLTAFAGRIRPRGEDFPWATTSGRSDVYQPGYDWMIDSEQAEPYIV